MKAYHGMQAIVETQALIMINEKLREFSDQIDEAHVCFLPFAAKRIAEKIICFFVKCSAAHRLLNHRGKRCFKFADSRFSVVSTMEGDCPA